MIVPEQVITGEGVVVDIAPAPLPTRMGSAVIDYAVYFLGFIVLSAAFGTPLLTNRLCLRRFWQPAWR